MDSGESTAQYNAGGDDVAVATAKVSRTPVSGARNRGGKVTRGQDGGLHPRVILPTEVWAEVFDLVDAPRDWLHCFYSSSIFRKEPWLKWEKQRIVRLFPEVLRILNKHNSLKESDYLTLRAVSKSWKRSTDQFLQHSTLQFCLSSTPEKPWIDLWTAIEFFDNHAPNFLASVDYWISSHAPTVNPFPSRQLEFWDMHVNSNNRLKFKEATINFLTKFGHHLWYFSYHACRDDMFSSPVEWYTTVRQWLLVMPNLKKICLSYGGDNHVLDNDTLALLEEFVATQPFPSFENLVTLETEYLPYSILNSAVTVNNQLKRLEQHPNSYRLPWTNFGALDLSQLTEFTSKLYTTYDIHQLRMVNWPLKILNLRCWNVNVDPTWSFAEIIHTIEHFQGTLTSLKLEVTMIEPDVQLDMPLLEQLEVDCDNDGENFVEFVASLKKLRTCTLSVDLSGNDNNVIPFESVESHIRGMKIHVARRFVCPLWDVLPELSSVFVQTYVPPYRVQYDYTYNRDAIP